MSVAFTAVHWIYLFFLLVIVFFLLFRRDITIICILGIFILTLSGTSSPVHSFSAVFNGLIYSVKMLLGPIILLSISNTFSRVLMLSGLDAFITAPLIFLMKKPWQAYCVIGISSMIFSWFFWPVTASLIVAAMLFPAAVKAGLPPIGAAQAFCLFSCGMALSSDVVIGGISRLTADAANIPVRDIIINILPLSAVMGIVTLSCTFISLRRDIKSDKISKEVSEASWRERYITEQGLRREEIVNLPIRLKVIFSAAIFSICLLYLTVVCFMNYTMYEAAAVIGGAAVIVIFSISAGIYKKACFEKAAAHFIEGLHFSIKVFGPIIPVTAFFYFGGSGLSDVIGNILPSGSHGIIKDLSTIFSSAIVLGPALAAIIVISVGILFTRGNSPLASIPAAAAVIDLISPILGGNTSVLLALGQMTVIWIGGWTLRPRSIISICTVYKVNPIELAERNLRPVILGMCAAAAAAIVLY